MSGGPTPAPAPALTDEEYKKAIKYRYDVWGAGYNWMQSNGKSADDVWKFIKDEVLEFYSKKGIKLNAKKQVLLISHSMGGVVARSLCAKLDAKHEEAILGVLHIAQPAAGAPATYRIMRAGDTGVIQMMSGRNAAETTGVLARAQGALELLPFAKYNNEQPWLTCAELPDRKARQTLDLPFKDSKTKIRDPYTSIYKTTEWYGLLPDQSLKLALEGKEATDTNLTKVRNDFSSIIDDVGELHKSITITYRYHPVMYAIWGESEYKGLLEDLRAWEKLRWDQEEKTYRSSDEPVFDYSEYRDNGLGCVSAGNYKNILRETPVPGDGTVPDASARDQKAAATIYFIQGDGNGVHNDKEGWSHQKACNDPRVKWAAIYSIIKLVSEHCP